MSLFETEVINLLNKRKKINTAYICVMLIMIMLGVVIFITKDSGPENKDYETDESSYLYETLPENLTDSISPYMVTDNKEPNDNSTSFDDYTLVEVECESGTLTLETLQQLLKSSGRITEQRKDGCTYIFSNSNNQAVVAEFNADGICTMMYRIY